MVNRVIPFKLSKYCDAGLKNASPPLKLPDLYTGLGLLEMIRLRLRTCSKQECEGKTDAENKYIKLTDVKRGPVVEKCDEGDENISSVNFSWSEN